MTDINTDNDIVSVLANLTVNFGQVAEQIRKQRDWQRQAYAAQQPFYIRFHGTIVASATGFGVISFDNCGPDLGHIWNVRNLAVGGLTPTTVAAGRADVYVSASSLKQATSLTSLGLVGWRDQADALPLVAPYGQGELFLHGGERLFVVISNGTSGQEYVCTGTAQDTQEHVMRQEWAS